MDRDSQSAGSELREAESGPQVRLRLNVVDRRTPPDAERPKQRISLTTTYPPPGEEGSWSVYRGTAALTEENLLLARDALRLVLSQVEHELRVHRNEDGWIEHVPAE